jgi:hypothetical protein
MKRYEAIPSQEWQELYIAIRREDPAEREQAVQAITRAVCFQMTPREFINRETVRPFPHPAGGTIWVDLSQNWLVFRTEAGRVRCACSDSRITHKGSSWRNAQGHWESSRVNQVVRAQPGEWWDTPQSCVCNVPIVGIWDRATR